MKIFLRDGSVQHTVAMGVGRTKSGKEVLRPALPGERVADLSPSHFASFDTAEEAEAYRLKALEDAEKME